MKTVQFDEVCNELMKAGNDAQRLRQRMTEVNRLLQDCVSGPEYLMLWKTIKDINTIQERIASLHTNYGPF